MDVKNRAVWARGPPPQDRGQPSAHRLLGADSVPQTEITRRLGLSRNTVAKYADMEDMSPAAPVPAPRDRPALEGNGAWVESVLEADAGAPRKQRHTARRIYDRLVEERGFAGSYSTVRRFVRDRGLSQASGPEKGPRGS